MTKPSKAQLSAERAGLHHELRVSGKYRPRTEQSAKAYKRHDKHKKGSNRNPSAIWNKLFVRTLYN